MRLKYIRIIPKQCSDQRLLLSFIVYISHICVFDTVMFFDTVISSCTFPNLICSYYRYPYRTQSHSFSDFSCHDLTQSVGSVCEISAGIYGANCFNK